MDSSSSESDGDYGRQPRKRIRNPASWKEKISKEKKNLGQAYFSRATKKEIAAREIGPRCRCANKCFDKIGMENVNKMFSAYYALGDYNAQSHYIHKCVEEVPVKRVRVKDHESRGKFTRKYSVVVGKEKFVVCQKAFLSIHGITEGRVRVILAKASSSESGNILPDDQRGRHEPHNKTSTEARDFADKFIQALPTCSSHYSRAKSPNRMYMPPGSTYKGIYRSYCNFVKEEKKMNLKVSEYVFQNLMHEYNIGIQPPQSDTCNVCDEFKNKMENLVQGRDDDEILRLRMERVPHIAHAKVAQRFLKTFSSDQGEGVGVIAMDLQQTLATPRLSSGVQYYKRKLWTYNFCIHNCKEKKAYFYVWNEAEGKRGSDEICSCLDHFVSNFLSPNVKKFIIFSDNCGGQNKNINVVMTYLRWIHATRFSRIEQFFMEPGHSYLPCDRDFGNLEIYLKGREVYTTSHYVSCMENARPNNPFIIIEMNHLNFYSFSSLEKSCTKAGQKLSGFKKAKKFIASEEDKKGITVCAGFGDYHDPVFMKLQKGRSNNYNQTFNLSSVELPLKYPSGVKLDGKKLQDLRDLMRFIPSAHKSFFTDIFSSQEAMENLQEDHSDEENPDDDFLDY